MNLQESPSPSESWLRIAHKDWRRSRVMLAAEDPSAAGFFLQQSIEKVLKAWLLDHGWVLRKTHALAALVDAAGEYDHDLVSWRPYCERVAGYYVIDRYPNEIEDGPSVEDVRRDLEDGLELIRTLFPLFDPEPSEESV